MHSWGDSQLAPTGPTFTDVSCGRLCSSRICAALVFRAYMRSSSSPRLATAFALIHPMEDASRAMAFISTVLPAPLGPRKMVARFGSPGWFASPSITSSISSSRPAKAKGACPNVGVKGFLRNVAMVLLSLRKTSLSQRFTKIHIIVKDSRGFIVTTALSY